MKQQQQVALKKTAESFSSGGSVGSSVGGVGIQAAFLKSRMLKSFVGLNPIMAASTSATPSHPTANVGEGGGGEEGEFVK